jgi:hypothetical protein
MWRSDILFWRFALACSGPALLAPLCRWALGAVRRAVARPVRFRARTRPAARRRRLVPGARRFGPRADRRAGRRAGRRETVLPPAWW